MERFDLDALDLDAYDIPDEDGVVLARRKVLGLFLGAGAGALAATLDPRSAEANTPPPPPSVPWAHSHYSQLGQRIQRELDAGPAILGHPLADAVSDLPELYYEHDATKIVDSKGKNVPSPSIAFEVAKKAWFEIKGEVAIANAREISLDKLRLAAQPGMPFQQRRRSVYVTNFRANRKLKPYWEALQADSYALVRAVQSLVLKERAAAKKMKTPATAPSALAIVVPETVIPTSRKDAALKRRHDAERDDCEDIEHWLRPSPYYCDRVSASLRDRPSSIMVVEALKTLQFVADQYLRAADRRKHSYHGLQAYVQRTGQKARPLLKYDNTSQNDPIFMGWRELLRERLDANNRKGLIPDLIERVVKVVQAQSAYAERIHRCVG